MKYIKGFDYIVENKRNAKRFKNKDGLMRNDQFSGNVSLSKTLADELGFDPKKEFSEGVGFDNISMYDTASGKTIVDDALSGEHTYDDLVKLAKEWYKKNESVEVVTEAKFVKSYDTKVNNAETEKEVLNVYPKAKFFVGKMSHFFGELEPNLFFKAYYPKYYKQDTGKTVKGDFKITSVYSKKGSNYVELMKESILESKEDFEPHMMYDPKTGKGYKADTYEDHLRMDKMGYTHEKPENIDESKKFKPGDMWSDDFDYEGMLKYGLKVNVNSPIKMLNKLFDSATDVNYHTPFRNLGIAIDWIEDGDKKGAKDYMKNFHNDIKAEMKSQGIK